MSPSRVPPVPAVLRLVQRAVLGRWRATGDDLYREVARLAEIGAGKEVAVVGCGDGLTAHWLAMRTGASVTGVDSDADGIALAESRARAEPRSLPLQFETGALDDLPHETGVFDVVIGEPPVSAAPDPKRAVSELVRVTKPGGRVVLLQPTWTREMPDGTREMVVERLGLRPHLLVEWKQMMRDAGLVDLQVQDWTSGAPGQRGGGSAENGDAPPTLTLPQKVQIVSRAWRRWGWREARAAVERETTLIRELSRERAIGFQLITGVKWPHQQSA